MTYKRFKDLVSLVECNSALEAFAQRDGATKESIMEYHNRKNQAIEELLAFAASRVLK